FRQVADGCDLGRCHADVHELLERAVGGDHAESAPAGVDEFDGRLDDALEHMGEFELADDMRHGVEQSAQARLVGGVGHASSLPERGPDLRVLLADSLAIENTDTVHTDARSVEAWEGAPMSNLVRQGFISGAVAIALM